MQKPRDSIEWSDCTLLISDQSGCAELLATLCPGDVHHFVVPTNGDLSEDGRVWGEALERVLRDRDVSFQRARDLRAKLNSVLSWDLSAAQLLAKAGQH